MLGHRIAECSCGRVELRAIGEPILHVACYCKDCQTGGLQIQALAGAVSVLEADGGTDFLLYRKDRVNYLEVEPLLRAYKLDEGSATSRFVAPCCNAAMFLNFEKGHWLTMYRQRFRGDVPPLQMRVCTQSKRDDVVLANDVPNHGNHSFSFLAKLIAAWIPMLLRR